MEETRGEDNEAKQEGATQEEQYEEEAEAEAEEQTGERRIKVSAAKNRPRTYLQEWAFGKWKLVVEVSEAMTSRHTFVIERIHKAMRQRPSMDKQDALQMRKDILGK